MQFRCYRVSLQFEAYGDVSFPRVMAANVFRGALGTALPPHLFAPRRVQPSPSGLADPPRPFVLRARHLDGRRFTRGERFTVYIHLFGPFAEMVTRAFHEAPPFYGAARLVGPEHQEIIDIPLLPLTLPQNQAIVRFLTPTELKADDNLEQEPGFSILFGRALTRLRTLAGLYAQPIDVDFDRLALSAEAVVLTHSQLTHQAAQRRSTRTGQTHSLGGFTGTATYRGDFRELLPFLNAAALAGVGRQTVWGKGEIEIVAS